MIARPIADALKVVVIQTFSWPNPDPQVKHVLMFDVNMLSVIGLGQF